MPHDQNKITISIILLFTVVHCCSYGIVASYTNMIPKLYVKCVINLILLFMTLFTGILLYFYLTTKCLDAEVRTDRVIKYAIIN